MPLKILIVDDNPDHLRITKRVLEKSGGNYVIDTAANGEEGLEKVFDSSYDAVVCDYLLPGLNALEMVKRLKETYKDIPFPFIVMTAAGNEKIAVELMKEGASDYVAKNVLEDTLVKVVNSAVEKFKTRREKEALEEKIKKTADELKEAYEKLRTTQETLMHSEKMAALGTLSAGVVHEINNPLMGVMLLVQSMMSDKGISRGDYKVFSQIEEGLKRIADVVTKLLKFARREKVTLEKINMNNIVRSVLPLVTREFELNGIELSVNYGKDIPLIKASVSEIQQVLINILLNAKDAVLDSGFKKISVTTSSKDDAVKLKIKDEGSGIGKAVLEKIFEPFFTTKSKKKGVGLGLFIVRTIMDQYGGKIEIHSKEGKGTEVVLSFSVSK